ncbi:NAD(P)-binding protein [Mollisia scopiformis]|uniref:NAD(P)-binding protein n=1 Tax=Mollisia scopiformis TaxID=149040 RepID=A0A132B2K0_MOLSC|nr:NAD(P)-binding protein [Mollisia scopiformis]KUJ06628.1 NAD(P)-binding protein [Mollisia scopiformis]
MENLPVDYFVTSQAFTKQTYRDVYPAIDPSSPLNKQDGKVIVITGASKGLGRLGIVLVARTAESLQSVAKEINAINPNIEVLPVPTDLTNPDSIAAMWEKVKTKFDHADVLVNNAGTLTDATSVKDADSGKWWYDFEVNGRGTFLITQGFLKLLGDKKGTVINLTTGAAHTVFPNLSAYSISKLTSLQLIAYISAENPNVNAVSVHPGILPTDMTIEPFKRFALDTPELVGGVVVWLASEEAEFLRGRYISANWSVEELVTRKEEILKENKLTMALVGKFGMDQFA